MSKNTIRTAVALLILAGSIFSGSIAFAKDDEKNTPPGLMKGLEKAMDRLEKFETKVFKRGDFEKKDLPATLEINPEGKIRITKGTVTSVGGAAVGVKIWGLSFSAAVASSTKILAGNGEQSTLADIKVGDMVNVVGDIREDAPGVIAALAIHDRTAQGGVRQDEINKIRSQIEELIKRLENLLKNRTATSTSA